jgi:hypothetical protein
LGSPCSNFSERLHVLSCKTFVQQWGPFWFPCKSSMQLMWLCSSTRLCFPLKQESKICLLVQALSFKLQFWCKVHSLNLTHFSRHLVGWLRYVLPSPNDLNHWTTNLIRNNFIKNFNISCHFLLSSIYPFL